MCALPDKPVRARLVRRSHPVLEAEASGRRRSRAWKFAPSTLRVRRRCADLCRRVSRRSGLGCRRAGSGAAQAWRSAALSPHGSRRHRAPRRADLRRVRRRRPAHRRRRHLRRRPLSTAVVDDREVRARLPASRPGADRQGPPLLRDPGEGPPARRARLPVVPRGRPAATSAAASAAPSSRACTRTPTAPVYLDTANPANVPYYASNGFEEIGKVAGPRGATMWFMTRP